MPVKVFLITDFLLLMQALEGAIGSHPERFALAGQAECVDAAAGAIVASSADIVLLDIDGAPEQVLPAIAALKIASKAKILLLTRLNHSALQDQAVISGARGVVDRQIRLDQLLIAIEKVHAGEVWLDRTATGRLFVELSRTGAEKAPDSVEAKLALLTEREQEIVAFVARNRGDSGKIVATKMHISESTLRNHLTSIYDKLGVTNRHGLLAYAYRHDLEKRLAEHRKSA